MHNGPGKAQGAEELNNQNVLGESGEGCCISKEYYEPTPSTPNMNAREIVPSSEDLKLVHGIEAELLQRRRKGMLGGIVAIGAAVLQVIVAAVEKDYLGKVGKFFNDLSHWHIDASVLPELLGIGVIVLGIGIYFTYRWTSVLLKESEEPFQYTFWIEPFQLVSGTSRDEFDAAMNDRLSLLHHDLRERLSVRIKRLSLLNAESDVPQEARKNLSSHINVRGDYAVRLLKDDKWVLQVMPMIRIGPVGRPATLASPVKAKLNRNESDSHEQVLSAGTYNQLIERIYSEVASEIYRQILSDVKKKSAFTMQIWR
jgi:hypothetical protein